MTEAIVDFLRARLDEDEAIALATIDINDQARMRRGQEPPRWVVDGSSIIGTGRSAVLHVKHTWHWEAAHISRHDPARVLTEVAAKRRIIAAIADADPHGAYITGTYRAVDVMLDLAAVYDQHPDYREEWRS